MSDNVDAFEAMRPTLPGLAYRILGMLADAETVISAKSGMTDSGYTARISVSIQPNRRMPSASDCG